MSPQEADLDAADGRALALGLAYINRRERTVAEVRERLVRADLPGTEIVSALDELEALGMLDDARYARLFAEDKRTLDGWGGERIARVLRERGVNRDEIEAVLADEDAEDELERAVAHLARRFPGLSQDAGDRERALGFLIRRGFASELALDAVRRWRGSATELPS